MKVAIIAAKASNNAIGFEGQIPWRLPGDLRRVRAITMGKPIIMGRKTWDSLPKKPLDGRLNIVVTRQSLFEAAGAEVASNLSAALGIARASGAEEAVVFGGSSLYAEALALADRLYLTEVLRDFPGDAFFPDFVRADWSVASKEAHLDADPPHVFYVLEKKN
jgi:dihydrofolate reductase